MTHHRLLQIGPITPALDAKLATLYDIHPLWQEGKPAAFLAEHGTEFEGVVTHLRHACPAELLAALPQAKFIVNFGVGYDKIDLAAARQQGLQVANTPKVLDGCVADLAFGLMLDVARGLSATDRFVRRGDWKTSQRPLMTRVYGKRLGLLGFGGIGQTIARRASGFDLDVRYHSRKPVAGSAHTHVASLIELAQWADFLVVACVGGPSTRHLVSREVLDALGPQGILVNIARGTVVDEVALVAALGEGRLGGAGLDVFENEPHVPAPLLGLDNVVLLSHIAGFTRESRRDMEQLVCDNLASYFASGKVLTPV